MIFINIQQSHTVKICYLFSACKAIIVSIVTVVFTWGVKMVGYDRCSSSKWSQNHIFLSNIITVIICSILMPWNAANAAYLWLIAAWNISHCDWLLTCWHIIICMPNTNHHVNPKPVGVWTNLSLNSSHRYSPVPLPAVFLTVTL